MTALLDYKATQDARNTIELNIRKYALMLCDALIENFKSRNNGKTDGYKSTLSLSKYHKVIMRQWFRSVHAY